jgi:hypothetical protein
MNAVMLRKGRTRQLALDFGLAEDTRSIEMQWRNAEEGERKSRARFAQNALKPEEVAPEWQRWRELLGSPDQVRRFVDRAMSRLDAPLEPTKGSAMRAHLDALPAAVRERLAAGASKARCDLHSKSRPRPARNWSAVVTRCLQPWPKVCSRARSIRAPARCRRSGEPGRGRRRP